MFSHVSDQLTCRARWLLSGRIDEIVAEHRFPLPVDIGPSRLVIRTADEAAMLLRHLGAAYGSHGIRALLPKVTAIDLPRSGRFRVWVDWHAGLMTGPARQIASVIYYCRQVPSGLQIEMVDCTSMLLPGLQPELTALAMSA
jgi:hypothetical protein